MTNNSPVRLKDVREALGHGQSNLVPPPGGSLCRMVSFPPEKGYLGRISAAQVQAYFAQVGAPAISTHSAFALHPYMQKSRMLDFCFVIERRITLVLDTDEVHLDAGDIVVQRGSNHAASSRGDAPCVMVFSAHDAFV